MIMRGFKSKAAGGGRQTLAAVGSPAVFELRPQEILREKRRRLSQKNILKFITSCETPPHHGGPHGWNGEKEGGDTWADWLV